MLAQQETEQRRRVEDTRDAEGKKGSHLVGLVQGLRGKLLEGGELRSRREIRRRLATLQRKARGSEKTRGFRTPEGPSKSHVICKLPAANPQNPKNNPVRGIEGAASLHVRLVGSSGETPLREARVRFSDWQMRLDQVRETRYLACRRQLRAARSHGGYHLLVQARLPCLGAHISTGLENEQGLSSAGQLKTCDV